MRLSMPLSSRMNDSPNESHAQILAFLIELRRRFLTYFFVVAVVFLVLLLFANQLYTFLALPLLKHLPQGHLIATQIMAPFLVPFKLAFIAALLVTVPFFLYQLWAFMAPALYHHERRLLWILIFVSTLLFYSGMAFAYWVIFPLLFHFFVQTVPHGVVLSPDMTQYLDLTMQLLFVFGGLFEIPIAMMLLIWSGVMTRQRFVKMRPYAIVGAFIVGMLLAPPDVLSQTLLAIPIWLLYEGGIVLSRFLPVRRV